MKHQYIMSKDEAIIFAEKYSQWINHNLREPYDTMPDFLSQHLIPSNNARFSWFHNEQGSYTVVFAENTDKEEIITVETSNKNVIHVVEVLNKIFAQYK